MELGYLLAISQGGKDTTKFPIMFPNSALGIVAGGEYSDDGQDNNVQLNATNTSFSMKHGNGGLRVYWIAVGY